MDRDRILIAEAKSAITQITHILGDDRTQRILNEIDTAATEVN
jgi:hypothetical protein